MGGLCCTGLQEGGKDEIIEKLISLGFDIDSTSNDGITPLMVLACHDQFNAFKIVFYKENQIRL